jgi:hypothetical protein
MEKEFKRGGEKSINRIKVKNRGIQGGKNTHTH